MDFNQILTYLNQYIDTIPWDIVGQTVLASGALSAVLTPVSLLLRKYHNFIKLALVFASAVGLATFHYLQSNAEYAPYLVTIQGLVLTVMAKPYYKLIFKPALAWIGNWFTSTLATAEAYRQEAKTAIVPEAGLPITALPTLEVQNFDK